MQNIVDEILTWPRTPSQQQLEEAEETLRQIESERPFPDSNKPTQARKVRDALILSSCRSFPEFRRKALEDFRAGIHQIGADPDRTIALVAEISWRGDSDMTIGVATQTGPLKPSSPDMSYNFGQVPRHPEWTGFSPLWREMKGLYVITAESHWRPGEAGIIIARNDDMNRNEAPNDMPIFPDGEPAIIRELLQWHGAAQWAWLPVEYAL